MSLVFLVYSWLPKVKYESMTCEEIQQEGRRGSFEEKLLLHHEIHKGEEARLLNSEFDEFLDELATFEG